MKIRTGFVSNSSSSSFVVAFSHKPESVEDLKEMMFGKQEWHHGGCYGDSGDVPTKDIADAVFREVKDKESAGKLKVYKAIRHGYFSWYMIESLLPGRHDSFDMTKHLSWDNDRDEMQRCWTESEKINDGRAIDIANAFLKVHDGEHFIATMWFADEDGGFWSMMEHSGIFGRLDHIRTSYH